MERLKSLGIRVIMYKRYIDDVIIDTERIKEAYIYIVKKTENVPEGRIRNSDQTDNKHTLETLAEIDNTSKKDIVMHPDMGENHGDNRLNVLDLAKWMEGVWNKVKIRFSFYRKLMASEYLKTQRSAM